MNSQVWMSHGDTIERMPANYKVTASTADVENAAFAIEEETSFGIQFHPEVYHSTEGIVLLKNFIVNICGCSQDWTPDAFVETTVAELKSNLEMIASFWLYRIGVDSTVAGMLLHKAIGKNLYCIFVDNGLLRKNEFTDVLKKYESLGLNVKGVDAAKVHFCFGRSN